MAQHNACSQLLFDLFFKNIIKWMLIERKVMPSYNTENKFYFYIFFYVGPYMEVLNLTYKEKFFYQNG